MEMTQKELELLKDLKTQEQLCVKKYNWAAQTANDPQLSELFSEIASTEKGHLQFIESLQGGTLMQEDFSQAKHKTFTASYGTDSNSDKNSDTFLCNDLLTTEKHASHLYDTCIFEFVDDTVRERLNNIQSQEQSHGKMIYDYMSANNMY